MTASDVSEEFEDQEPDVKAVRVRLHGRVQGVWYRRWAEERAGDLGLDGWVRNRRDGTVEAVFSGPAEDVDRMVRLCRAGPPHAQVEEMAVLDEPVLDAPGFEVRETI